MKKLITFIFTTFIGLSLFATDLFTFSPLKGTVKNYTQTDFSVASKFGSYYRTPNIKEIHVFDGAGKEVESTQLTPRDAVLNKIASSYDMYGNLTDEVCTDADGKTVWKNVTAYKDGKKDSCSEYDEKGNLKGKSIYTYEDNKLIDETGYNGDGVLVWKTIYKYDETNRILSISEYSSDGSLSTREEYAYTETGAIDTVTTYDGFSENTTQRVFRYTNNLLTEITTYGNNKEVTNRVIYKYDSIGNPIKVSEYNIANKFGTTVNELVFMSEVVYNY